MQKANLMQGHDSVHLHVRGESEFVGERALFSNEVFVGLITSTIPKGRVVKINFEELRKISGFLGLYTSEDFAQNQWGTIFKDQPLLATNEVKYNGEPIAIFAVTDPFLIPVVQKKTKVVYEEFPAILSIEDAIEKKSFLPMDERKIERGEVGKYFFEGITAGMEQNPKTDQNCKLNGDFLILDGKLKIKGAEHFYLESQACVVYPKEDGQFEVHSSTQHPTETQHLVAHALGLNENDVVCIVPRMGGAFGGKESQAAPFAAYAALVAKKLKRPARLVISKDEDMIITGKRNPFLIFYKVAVSKTSSGKILALEAKMYSDAGAYADLSSAIMERAMLHIDNAYFIPNLKVTGRVCLTNHHSHTAFRGFGGPKGVAVIERVIEEISAVLKIDALKIRKLNCYKTVTTKDNKDSNVQNTTHYGQRIESNHLFEIFEKLESDCQYWDRRKKVEEFNKKMLSEGEPFVRGLSMTAVKFGISFTTRFLNQGNAFVIVNRDGSVLVSTGATEMGQGVNARIAKIVATTLGISRDQVRVSATRTDKNANTSPTAASSGTDLNGTAAEIACLQIKNRLAQVARFLGQSARTQWPSKTAGLGTQAEFELRTQRFTLRNLFLKII